MHTSIIALLQITTSILLALRGSPQTDIALQRQVLLVANRVVQFSFQATAPFPENYAPIPNRGRWPTAADLEHSLYLSGDKYIPLGANMQMLPSYASFGDLNGDGADDAVVVVRETPASGGVSYALAVMLNQGGMLFNITDIAIANLSNIDSHRIESGRFNLGEKNGKNDVVSHYELWGNQLIKR